MLSKQLVRMTKRFISTKTGIISSKVQDIILPRVPLHEYVWQYTAKFSERIAMECFETGHKYTYNEIYNYCKSLSHFLANRLKLVSGERAAIILPNLPEFPIVLLGSMQADLTVTTCNPNYTIDEIKMHLVRSNPKVVFTTKTLVETVKKSITKANLNMPIVEIDDTRIGFSRGVISFNEIISYKSKEPLPDVDPDHVALLPFSSGTTGHPKGVQLTHFNMVSNLSQFGVPEFDHVVQDPQDIVPGLLPFFHIYGLSQLLIFSLLRGAKVVSLRKFSSDNYVQLLRTFKPTLLYVVPPIAQLTINNEKLKSEYLTCIRTLICGAAPLGGEDVERLHDKAKGKLNVLQAYGMTETSPLILSQTPLLPDGIKVGGCGLLIPNTLAKIISIEDGTTKLGPNESGQLLIKGPQVMKGYYQNEEATNEMIQPDGWLKTGDVAHYDENEHFFVTDRLKELIKVKSFQVAPAELEEVIRGHPDVADVGVVGVAHSILGEAPKAFVVLKENAIMNPESIKEFVVKRLSKEKHLVGGISFVSHIPKTPSGKLLRRDLRKLL